MVSIEQHSGVEVTLLNKTLTKGSTQHRFYVRVITII